MVLVITDSMDLSMVYATSLGGVMIGKQSIRRKNLDENRELLLTRASEDGTLTTFFRGEQYVFVSLPYGTYALNRMADYQEEYSTLEHRPIPYFPNEFLYRVCDESTGLLQNKVRSLCSEATSIVNAVSDSIPGMLAFLHFQKMFDINKTITRAKPRILSEEKILEAFNAREDSSVDRDFADACLLYERLNWLVNCNVSNAIMQATGGRITMAAGRLEAVLLKTIENATASSKGPIRVILRNSRSSHTLPCTLVPDDGDTYEILNARRGTRCEMQAFTPCPSNQRHICNSFNILVRAGMEYGIPLHEATDALWRLFSGGYITWPSPSQTTPWSMKPALTAGISQLAIRLGSGTRMSPADIERYCAWSRDDESDGRTATIVTAKASGELTGAEGVLYQIISEGMEREFSGHIELVTPVFQSGSIRMTAQCVIPKAELLEGHWTVAEVFGSGGASYMDWNLLADVLPYFSLAFCEDFRHFLTPLSNLLAWGMAEKTENGGYRVTPRGRLLLKYASSTPLVDPAATTFWDVRMQRVATGKVSAKEVLADFSTYVNDLVAFVKVAVEVIEATGGIAPCECVCPVCGSLLEWDGDSGGWSCSGTGQACSFVLPGKFRGHTLSVRDMALLLTTGETDMAFDFFGAKSGPFPARIILTEEKKPALSFSSRCKCPQCKSRFLNEFMWGLACPDRGCGFSLNTQRNGVRLTEEDEVKLLSGEKTRWINDFVSSRGARFTARLYLTEDLKIKFEFPERK